MAGVGWRLEPLKGLNTFLFKGLQGPPSIPPIVFTDHLSPEQLVGLHDMVERDVRKALNIPFNPGAPAFTANATTLDSYPGCAPLKTKTNGRAKKGQRKGQECAYKQV